MSTPHVSMVLLLVALSACSSSDDDGAGGGAGSGGSGGSGGGSDCGSVDNVSDGPTTDEVIESGATVLICYYAQPSEGYCRKITDAGEIQSYVDTADKGAIGCADAVILAGPDCPTLNATGFCNDNSIDAQRVYYTCSKFDNPEGHCADISGTFVAP